MVQYTYKTVAMVTVLIQHFHTSTSKIILLVPMVELSIGTKVLKTVIYYMQFSNKTLLKDPVGLYIGTVKTVKSNIPTSRATRQ